MSTASGDGSFLMFVTVDGTLWAKGWNSLGGLGDGTTITRFQPVRVANGVSAVSAGGSHTLFTTKDGSLWAMGDNTSGQLGDGTFTSRLLPVQVTTGLPQAAHLAVMVQPAISVQPKGQEVAVGETVTFEVTASGGGLTFQWLKDDIKIPDATSPEYVIESAQLSDSGSYNVQVSNGAGSITSATASLAVFVPPAVTAPPMDQTVAAGGTVTLSVGASGTPPLKYQWYKNGRPISGATDADYQISAAQASDEGFYSVAVANGGGVVPALGPQVLAAGSDQELFIKADGTLWDSNNDEIARGVQAVAATGTGHTLFLKSDGTLWGMGSNQYGELGDGRTIARNAPFQIASGVEAVAVGYWHSLFLKSDGTLWGMGSNQYGQLGDGTNVDRHTPIQIASGVRAIAAGTNTSFFVKEDGTLWGMGRNASGQLGDGTQTDRTVPEALMGEVSAVSAGFEHTLILREDGSLWGTGRNLSGELGDGTGTNQDHPVWIADGVIEMAAGEYQSFFIRRDGTRWAMGSNYAGQLGDGTTESRLSPVPIGSGVRAMSTNYHHYLLLRDDGTLWRDYWVDLIVTAENHLDQIATDLPHAAFLTVTGGGPEISAPPRSQSAIAGDPIAFSVTATGAGTLSYQWRWNGNPIAGATSASLTIGSVQAADAGRYDVVVTDSAGAEVSPEATLWVQDVAPVSRALGYGGSITLNANVSGDVWSYQWLRNGAVISGANAATYTISSVGAGDVGTYEVIVTGVDGSTVLPADTISAGPALGSDGVLLGLSTRGLVGTGDDVMITGFWVNGSNPKQVVIRGLGPSLSAFGVGGTLANPRLDLYRRDPGGGSTLLTSNDDWENTPENVALMNTIGLPIPGSSLESLLVMTLDPGIYTAQLNGADNGTGVGLLEIYDADSVLAPDLPKLTAISTRGVVRSSDEVLIGGFIITGTEPKLVLVQVVGPSLDGSGVT